MNIITVEEARARIPELESVCRVRATSHLLGELAAYYFTLNDPERALPLAQKAYEKNRNPSIGMNLSLILKDLGRHDEALKIVEESYFVNSDDAYTQLGYAEGLLKAGFWKHAWPLYDNARPTQQGAAYDLRLPASCREWNGGPLPEGHLLLVVNEGGSGDRLSYARFLNTLTELGIHWRFYPYQELFGFFERVFPRDKLIADGEAVEGTHWTTTFALMSKLGVGPHEVPPPLPLGPSPEAKKLYEMNASDGMPLVGICYSAAEAFQGGRKVRSLSEGQAMRLVTMTANQIHWVSVQHGETMPYPVITIPFKTWDQTAALIANLDALVTVDTGTLHLGGCIGKPMAVLLSSNACWKFLRSGTSCLWYPNVKLYRNEGFGRGVEHSIDLLIQDIRAGVWPAKEKCATA